MLTKCFQKLIMYFRVKYIESLNVYTINLDPNNLKPQLITLLPKYIQDSLEIHSAAYSDFQNKQSTKDFVQKLHLISFDKSLTTVNAKLELERLGFRPADLFEAVLFAQRYGHKLNNFPIVSLDAYLDEEGVYGIKSNDLYALVLISGESEFSGIGTVESREAEGASFRKGIFFLAKAI